VIVTGVGIGEGVDGVDGKDVVESSSDIGAVVVVVADASSGSMTADGRADRHLGWA
jgi:Mg-chelatase subunit ChlD